MVHDHVALSDRCRSDTDRTVSPKRTTGVAQGTSEVLGEPPAPFAVHEYDEGVAGPVRGEDRHRPRIREAPEQRIAR
jgi:hypothetical protein